MFDRVELDVVIVTLVIIILLWMDPLHIIYN